MRINFIQRIAEWPRYVKVFGHQKMQIEPNMYLADSQKVTGSLERCRILWTQSVIQMTV